MDAQQQLADMYAPEDLHPDLIHHVVEREGLGQVLHHPLVIGVPFFPMMNRMTNRQYLHKLAATKKALEAKNLQSYVFMHERPYRLAALQRFPDPTDAISASEYWKVVAQIWTDSENIFENWSDWHDIWSSRSPHRSDMMDADERIAFAAMPDQIAVWRGGYHKNFEAGFSWTTDRDKAVWFANRFAKFAGKSPRVAAGTVLKSDVLAYFEGRYEQEIVILPENITGIRSRRV